MPSFLAEYIYAILDDSGIGRAPGSRWAFRQAGRRRVVAMLKLIAGLFHFLYTRHFS